MFLHRLGNKSKIADMIQYYFPPHQLYIEPFFGAGGMFFNKPKAKYNIVNDFDSEVFNLFYILKTRKEDLYKAFQGMPVAQDLWDYWKVTEEKDPVMKAVRFLFLSNFGFLGKPQTLVFCIRNTKENILIDIEKANLFMQDVQFMNCDFRDLFTKISLNGTDKDNSFIYADPPYLECDNNYESSFTEADTLDLFAMLEESGIRWVMSEFDQPFIMDEARRRGLNIVYIGIRKNIGNRRCEILVNNYKNHPVLFDFTA